MHRPSMPRLAAAVAVTGLACYAFVVTPAFGHRALARTGAVPTTGVTASGPTSQSAPSVRTSAPPVSAPRVSKSPPVVFPPAGAVFLGVMTKAGPANFDALDAFTRATTYKPQVMEFSQGWATGAFDRSAFDKIVAQGMMPLVAWEPWDSTQEPASGSDRGVQPAYRLSAIADGAFDPYITRWAEGIKSLRYPVAIRFAHEMNGNWYPWCEATNGNRAGDYAKAWRHVHELFARAGVTNATWVWSPNIAYAGSTPLAELYPGDKYVDWIGLSGYYGTRGNEHYADFNGLFDPTFKELARFTHKPIVITETAATDAAGLKAHWITQLFAELPAHPDIIGVVWFEAVKGGDWRIAADPAAAAAFRQGSAAARYRLSWSVNTRQRT